MGLAWLKLSVAALRRLMYVNDDQLANPIMWNLFYSPGGLAKKGEKQSYYCDLCLVELNSDETMMAHKQGQKHLKKRKSFENQCIEEGKITSSDTCYIRPISAAKLGMYVIEINRNIRENRDWRIKRPQVTQFSN